MQYYLIISWLSFFKSTSAFVTSGIRLNQGTSYIHGLQVVSVYVWRFRLVNSLGVSATTRYWLTDAPMSGGDMSQANMRCWPNVGLLLGKGLWRWPNSRPMLGQCLMFAWYLQRTSRCGHEDLMRVDLLFYCHVCGDGAYSACTA